MAGAQLGAFTCFDLTINPHPTRFDFGMGKAAGMAQAGGFQSLVELDVLATDFKNNGHRWLSSNGWLILLINRSRRQAGRAGTGDALQAD